MLDGREIPLASSTFILISKGLVINVFIPLITVSSLGNASKLIAYIHLPIHLFSWNQGNPYAVDILLLTTLPIFISLPSELYDIVDNVIYGLTSAGLYDLSVIA